MKLKIQPNMHIFHSFNSNLSNICFLIKNKRNHECIYKGLGVQIVLVTEHIIVDEVVISWLFKVSLFQMLMLDRFEITCKK